MRYREQQSYQRCQKGEHDVSEEVVRRLSGTAAPAVDAHHFHFSLILFLFLLFLPLIMIVMCTSRTFAERLKLIDTTLLKCYIKVWDTRSPMVWDTEGVCTCLGVLLS